MVQATTRQSPTETAVHPRATLSFLVQFTIADDPKPEADKFRDLARELAVNEDEAAVDETLKRIVKTPASEKPGDEGK